MIKAERQYFRRNSGEIPPYESIVGEKGVREMVYPSLEGHVRPSRIITRNYEIRFGHVLVGC